MVQLEDFPEGCTVCTGDGWSPERGGEAETCCPLLAPHREQNLVTSLAMPGRAPIERREGGQQNTEWHREGEGAQQQRWHLKAPEANGSLTHPATKASPTHCALGATSTAWP